MKVKEEIEKVGFKFNIQKTNRGIRSQHFIANRWGNNGNSERLHFLGLQNHGSHGECNHEIKRHLLLGRKAMTHLNSISKS